MSDREQFREFQFAFTCAVEGTSHPLAKDRPRDAQISEFSFHFFPPT